MRARLSRWSAWPHGRTRWLHWERWGQRAATLVTACEWSYARPSRPGTANGGGFVGTRACAAPASGTGRPEREQRMQAQSNNLHVVQSVASLSRHADARGTRLTANWDTQSGRLEVLLGAGFSWSLNLRQSCAPLPASAPTSYLPQRNRRRWPRANSTWESVWDPRA